jgi:membrane-bound lytic murein transglycosylase B
MILRILAALLFVIAASSAPAQQPAPRDPAFDRFLAELWKDAQAKGISRATFDKAFAGVTPDSRVIATTKKQPEYNKPAGLYVNQIASPANAKQGLQKEKEWHQTLDGIEKKYRVERWVILAIWGMETSYGALKDKWDGIRSLATLAFAKYRDPYFRNELLVALRIIQDGHISREKFVSSWAGAMGQTQFMPTNFVDYAVDFNGDGRRDIWTSVPDVLASTANYFAKAAGGWKMGMPWGFEVIIPQGFDMMKSMMKFAEWTKLGVRRADGKAFPADGDGILFFPAGLPGPAFIVTPNFEVIKDYNDSDVYALAIGHLSDLMQGGGGFKAAWPTHGTQLPRDDRIAMQKKLAELGYEQTRFTAHIDFKMRDFVRSEQKKHGLVTDGQPNAALMQRMGLRPSGVR